MANESGDRLLDGLPPLRLVVVLASLEEEFEFIGDVFPEWLVLVAECCEHLDSGLEKDECWVWR